MVFVGRSHASGPPDIVLRERLDGKVFVYISLHGAARRYCSGGNTQRSRTGAQGDRHAVKQAGQVTGRQGISMANRYESIILNVRGSQRSQ